MHLRIGGCHATPRFFAQIEISAPVDFAGPEQSFNPAHSTQTATHSLDIKGEIGNLSRNQRKQRHHLETLCHFLHASLTVNDRPRTNGRAISEMLEDGYIASEDSQRRRLNTASYERVNKRRPACDRQPTKRVDYIIAIQNENVEAADRPYLCVFARFIAFPPSDVCNSHAASSCTALQRWAAARAIMSALSPAACRTWSPRTFA